MFHGKQIVTTELSYRLLSGLAHFGSKVSKQIIQNLDGYELTFFSNNYFDKNWNLIITHQEITRIRAGKIPQTFHGVFTIHPYKSHYRVNYANDKEITFAITAIQRQIKAIRIIRQSETKPGILVLHGGHVTQNSTMKQSLETLKQVLQETIPYAQQNNVTLHIENDFNDPRSNLEQLFASTDNIYSILESFQGDIGLTYDLSHGLLSSEGRINDALAQIRRLKPYIGYCHLTYPDRPYIWKKILAQQTVAPSKFWNIDGHSSFSGLSYSVQEKIDRLVSEIVENVPIICFEHMCPRIFAFAVQKRGCSPEEFLRDRLHLEAILSRQKQ